MRRFRFSIAAMLGVVLFAAVAVAALRQADALWDSTLFSLALGLLALAVLLAVHRTGGRRAFWLGFALVGGAYLGASLVPPVEARLLTTGPLPTSTPRCRAGGTGWSPWPGRSTPVPRSTPSPRPPSPPTGARWPRGVRGESASGTCPRAVRSAGRASSRGTSSGSGTRCWPCCWPTWGATSPGGCNADAQTRRHRVRLLLRPGLDRGGFGPTRARRSRTLGRRCEGCPCCASKY